MTLRPFCRATTAHNGTEVTCHRMLGHPGPHVSRGQALDAKHPEVRWYAAVDYSGPRAIEGRAS